MENSSVPFWIPLHIRLHEYQKGLEGLLKIVTNPFEGPCLKIILPEAMSMDKLLIFYLSPSTKQKLTKTAKKLWWLRQVPGFASYWLRVRTAELSFVYQDDTAVSRTFFPKRHQDATARQQKTVMMNIEMAVHPNARVYITRYICCPTSPPC